MVNQIIYFTVFYLLSTSICSLDAKDINPKKIIDSDKPSLNIKVYKNENTKIGYKGGILFNRLQQKGF